MSVGDRHACFGGRAGSPWARGDEGFTLVEAVVALALISVAVTTVAVTGGAERRVRARGAARALAAACHMARAEAIARGANVAVQFLAAADGYRFRLVVDGNGDGVRLADLASGTDVALSGARSLGQDFRNVRFAVDRDLPGIDGGESITAGTDPVRVGSSRLLVFTPDGAASGGTVYVAGESGAIFAVRVLAATARTRVLEYSAEGNRWLEG